MTKTKCGIFFALCFFIVLGCTENKVPLPEEPGSTSPVAAQTRTPLPSNNSPTASAPVGLPGAGVTSPNKPATDQLLCSTSPCPQDIPYVLFLQDADRGRIQVKSTFRAVRPAPLDCVNVGDLVVLARYDRAMKVALWMGTARLISAKRQAGQNFQMNFLIEQFSPTETRALAPVCPSCKLVQNINDIRELKPFLISINDPQDPSGLSAADKLHLQLTPENLSALNQAKFPSDTRRPLVIWLPQAHAEWRGIFNWMATTKTKTGRDIYWLYPRILESQMIPPSIPGVIEVDSVWLTQLERERANAVFVGAPAAGVWNGPVFNIDPRVQIPVRKLGQMLDSDLLSIWQPLRAGSGKLFDLDRTSAKVVVFSRGLDDYKAYYIARTLATRRHRQVYWYRSSFDSWKKKLPWDAPPATAN